MTIIVDKTLLALSNKIDNKFLLKLEENSNAIAVKTQLHFPSHIVICLKYKATLSKQCQFHFPEA